MGKKTSVYVDTSALIAFLDRSDSYHPLFVQLFSNPSPLLTTSLVIAEGHGWFLKRYDSFRALQFLSFIETLDILKIENPNLKEGAKILRKFSDQRLTLTDACGLALMKSYAIKTCWSTDRHLSLTGVPIIIHQ